MSETLTRIEFYDQRLSALAMSLDDVERIRKNFASRLRAESGSYREFEAALDATKVTTSDMMEAHLDDLNLLEKRLIRDLEGVMKVHPLGPYVQSMAGVGNKTLARLLSSVGWPGKRESVKQLWAFCGMHVVNDDPAKGGVAPRRRKGEKANWSNEAKMRVHLIAESCIKLTGAAYTPTTGPNAGQEITRARSPYRDIYDDARAKYEESVHDHECAQCGICVTCGNPPGASARAHQEDGGCVKRSLKPSPPGSALRLGHIHARALRLVKKAILQDLWLEAKRLDAEETTLAA
jgi:hypothetical protein